MKIFRLFISFILSFVFVSCDTIERDVDGDGHNSAYDAQGDNIDEDSFNLDDYSDSNSGQSGGKANNTKKSFTVSFYDEEDTLLDSDTFQYMTKPKYFGVKPFKEGLKTNNVSLTYSFVGWNEDKMADPSKAIATEKLPAVTKDTDYYAIFVLSSSSYKVTFKNEEVELASSFVNSGDKPTYDGDLPEKEKDKSPDGGEEYTYKFAGWNEDSEANPTQAIKTEDLPPVSKTTIYFAIFVISTSYKVTFKNGEVELASSFVNSGDKPTYDGDLPKKDKDKSADGSEEYTYRFAGWHEDSKANPTQAIKTEDLPPVSKTTIYFAIYFVDSSDVEFSIKFYYGKELLYSDTVLWGSYPSYDGRSLDIDPAFTSNGNKKTSTIFEGWGINNPNASPKNAVDTANLPNVYADTIYYAVYSTITSYKVSFMNANNLLTDPIYVENGKTPTYTGLTPERESTTKDGRPYHYEFVGWNTNPNATENNSGNLYDLNKPITGPTTYNAIFKGTFAYIKFNKPYVELDCRDNNQSKIGRKPGWTEIENLRYDPYFPKTETITAKTPANSLFSIEWTLSSADTNYFSLNKNSSNPFSIEITALKPSRLGSLTAVITNKKTNEVEATEICQLRSVMTSVYYVDQYSPSKNLTDNKFDISASTNSTGSYYLYMFNPEGWGGNVDIVYPSMIKLYSSYNTFLERNFTYSDARAVCKIGELGNTDGNGPNTATRQIRNLFIPSSVVEITGNFFYYFNQNQANIIFEGGKSNVVLFSSYHRSFGRLVNLNTFPFNKFYRLGSIENIIDKTQLLNLFNNNPDIIVFKK